MSSNPLQWLRLFGPGAVMASLTIGAGELIFSARAGALFGYDVLWFFLLTLVMKWVMAYSIARHMVAHGKHPFERWSETVGIWLPVTMILLATLSFPIWTAFHAATTGGLLVHLLRLGPFFLGSLHLVIGVLLLLCAIPLCFKGGYRLLERLQLTLVLLLLGAVVLTVIKLKPDWIALLQGMFLPKPLNYPVWAREIPELSSRSPMLELMTYVGVLGGSSYDYLAYSSYIREKGWGRATTSGAVVDPRWFKAPLIDCTLSFLAVLVFTVVFVVCGFMVLAPMKTVPAGSNLLALQAAFVSPVYPGLTHLYFSGALLAMLGTLYGTIEVAPVLLREFAKALRLPLKEDQARGLAIVWVCGAGAVVLLILAIYQAFYQAAPPALITLLTPANLFTGVLGCGIICLLTVLIEQRTAPELRAPWLLRLLNLVVGIGFFIFGLMAYYQHNGWWSLLLLLGTVGAGVGASVFYKQRR